MHIPLFRRSVENADFAKCDLDESVIELKTVPMRVCLGFLRGRAASVPSDLGQFQKKARRDAGLRAKGTLTSGARRTTNAKALGTCP